MKNKKTFSRVLSYIKPYTLHVVISILCALISSCVGLLIPIFCGKAIDCMLGQGNTDLDGILKCIIYIAVAALTSAVAQQLLALFNNKITYCISRDLRNEALEKTHKLPLSYLDTHQTGDLVSRIISDIDAFADGLLLGFTQLFTGVITIIGTLCIMFYYNVSVTLIVVFLTPFSLFVASFVAKRTQKHFLNQAKIRGEQTALINESIDGMRVIQSYGRTDTVMSDFDALNDGLGKVSLKATFFSSLTNPGTRLVNNIVYAAVALVGALYALSQPAMTVGRISVFLSYAGQYAKPFNEISGVFTELQNALSCVSRVFELLDAEEEKSGVEYGETVTELNADGNVRLHSVSFGYVADNPLLKNISLDVPKGMKVAIVGPTGCGKTTLINLLMRFYDVESGCISVDGVDIRTVKRQALRANYGMVLQDTWLKNGTVKENIAYGKPNASDAEITEAAKSVRAHSFIRRLPNGYDTVIGEGGYSLSQGQKQLLCIARVMLCLPPMLILDEATSSIDTRTEMKIQAAFAKMMQGRTSFIVAHRLSTVKNSDLILVMKDGNIIEQGDHETLMQQNGFYTALYNSGNHI